MLVLLLVKVVFGERVEVLSGEGLFRCFWSDDDDNDDDDDDCCC